MSYSANEKSALIAMSGGVDSSVSACLIAEAGYRCMGATMRLYAKEETACGIDDPKSSESQKNLSVPGTRQSAGPAEADFGIVTKQPDGQAEKAYIGSKNCCTERDVEDAALVCAKLSIPFEAIDMTGDFRKHVIEPFVSSYERGETPNPCIECNRCLKFAALRKLAEEKGYDYIVTGHYARIEFDEKSGRYLLKRAVDPKKDQSYVLYEMTQEELAHTLFPLGSITKEKTREIAAAHGFINAKKHESQDICFVPDGDYVSFMEDFRGKKYEGGDFVDEKGNVVGRHRGAVHYTSGQRKGLGIALGAPRFVFDKDMERNVVYIGPEEYCFSTTFYIRDVNLIAVDRLDGPVTINAMTRYRGKEAEAVVEPVTYEDYISQGGKGPEGAYMKVTFREPQRAVTPGQACVFYDGDTVFGGGTIDTVLHQDLGQFQRSEAERKRQ